MEGGPNFCHQVVFADFAGTWQCALSLVFSCGQQYLTNAYVLWWWQHIELERVLRAVSLDKDVDGLHPINLGKLVLRGSYPTFVPCTPLGCLELLRRSGIQIEKKHAVVIGCSNVVGLPTAMLLQVTILDAIHCLSDTVASDAVTQKVFALCNYTDLFVFDM